MSNIWMICSYARKCTDNCPLKTPHKLDKHPKYYGTCKSECQGDTPGTKGGAHCVEVKR